MCFRPIRVKNILPSGILASLLVLVGLSPVIFMFGEGCPMARVLSDEGWRRPITGFLLGTTGAMMALSPAGMRGVEQSRKALTGKGLRSYAVDGLGVVSRKFARLNPKRLDLRNIQFKFRTSIDHPAG